MVKGSVIPEVMVTTTTPSLSHGSLITVQKPVGDWAFVIAGNTLKIIRKIENIRSLVRKRVNIFIRFKIWFTLS